MNMNIDRDEITASLVSTYKKELADLTDEELLLHFKAHQAMTEMTDDQWRAMMPKKG